MFNTQRPQDRRSTWPMDYVGVGYSDLCETGPRSKTRYNILFVTWVSPGGDDREQDDTNDPTLVSRKEKENN